MSRRPPKQVGEVAGDRSARIGPNRPLETAQPRGRKRVDGTPGIASPRTSPRAPFPEEEIRDEVAAFAEDAPAVDAAIRSGLAVVHVMFEREVAAGRYVRNGPTDHAINRLVHSIEQLRDRIRFLESSLALTMVAASANHQLLAPDPEALHAAPAQ